MRERGSCCQSEKEPLEDEQQTARSSETSSWGFSCHQPSSPVWRWVLSPRGPSVVSSRRDIMEIVWSGPIEAINHSLQAFPLWTAQLAATYTLFITKTKFFCSSNTTSPGSTGLPLIYNNCVCVILIPYGFLSFAKNKGKQLSHTQLEQRSTDIHQDMLYLHSVFWKIALTFFKLPWHFMNTF